MFTSFIQFYSNHFNFVFFSVTNTNNKIYTTYFKTNTFRKHLVKYIQELQINIHHTAHSLLNASEFSWVTLINIHKQSVLDSKTHGRSSSQIYSKLVILVNVVASMIFRHNYLGYYRMDDIALGNILVLALLLLDLGRNSFQTEWIFY